MGNQRRETVLEWIRHTWSAQAVNDVTDAALLHRFVQQRDAAAGWAIRYSRDTTAASASRVAGPVSWKDRRCKDMQRASQGCC